MLERTIWTWAVALLATVSLTESCPAQDSADRFTKEAGRLVKENDQDGDGKLSREEFPERIRRAFGQIDVNGDGRVTVEEAARFRRARAQGRRRPERGRSPLPTPDHSNVSYGPHERNVVDIWLATSDEPAPLVIYYHGGGFRGGDKRSLNPQLLRLLREGGVTVAAANYRLSGTAPFPAQMHDSARALQFLRHHAKKYNIDGRRVGATGGSAGAGISQWLAFHDDLADPTSNDPIARQSTRLSCAVVYAAQTSYDPRFIQKLFDTHQVDGALIPFFGMRSAEDVKDPRFHRLFEEASPINHLTADDVPVLYFYPQANEPLPPNSPGGRHIHHPKFGETIQKKFEELGVECVVKFREDYEGADAGGSVVRDYAEFFFRHLKKRQRVDASWPGTRRSFVGNRDSDHTSRGSS